MGSNVSDNMNAVGLKPILMSRDLFFEGSPAGTKSNVDVTTHVTPKSVKFCEEPTKISPVAMQETTSEERIESMLNKIKAMKDNVNAKDNSNSLSESDLSFSLPSKLDVMDFQVEGTSCQKDVNEADYEMSVLASQGGDLII